MKTPKVTGIGGIFFKCQNPSEVRNWYAQHLGFVTDAYGTNFEWRKMDCPDEKGYTVWSTFPFDTSYFGKSEQMFMINYRVENLDGLLEKLKSEGVTILDEVETFDYGRFVHILDGEGNKVELWEPVDEAYSAMIEDAKTNAS